MTKAKREMGKTDRAVFVAVLEALKAHRCITAYTIEGQNVTPEWEEHGFARAFEELKTSPTPLGLKRKRERSTLLLVLAKKDKKTVDEVLIGNFKAEFRLRG